MSKAEITLWTIGHSTHAVEEFIGLLASYKIETLADVRRFPGSRKYPHFNADALCRSLTAEGIEYLSSTELGGRRKPLPDSHNTIWRSESFRGYADYMETDAFADAIERLLEVARVKRMGVMCAEAVWWRCHRALISDYLKATDINVVDILGAEKSTVHPYTSAARIVDGQLTYTVKLKDSP